MRWRSAWLALLLLVPSLAAADAPVEYKARIEPRFPGAADLGPLAVAPFGGGDVKEVHSDAKEVRSDGKDFAVALRGELSAAEFDGHAFFAVRNLDDAVKADTPAAAVKAGQAAGAAAIFVGGAKVTIDKADYKQDIQRCTKQGLLNCSTNETVAVPCVRYTGVYVATPTLYVVADARVFYTETITVQDTFSTCAETAHQSFFDKLGTAMTAAKTADKVVVTTPEQLLTKLRGDAATAVRSHLTPTTKKIKVVFKDSARDLGKDDQAQFKSAVQFVRANRLDRACGIFETMLTPDKAKNVTLLYNLGACQEAIEPDRPATALAYYSKADQQTTAPDRLVSEAVVRVTALRDAMAAATRR